MPTLPEISGQPRGRNAASKPLNASSGATTSKSRSTTSASGSTSNRPSRPPSSSSTTSSKSSATGSPSKRGNLSRTPSRGDSESGFKVTKVSSTTVTLPTSWAPKPPVHEPPAAPEEAPMRTSDPLQVAAQVYPWMHMSSTLDACFKGAEATATNELETRVKDLAAEENEIADQRDRLEAERAIDFFDELGSDVFAKDAPAIMQLFHSHGESCTKIENEALQLANHPDPADEDPLKPYNDMLNDLEKLQNEATKLQNAILKLTEGSSTTAIPEGGTDGRAVLEASEESSARSQVSGIFVACLPVLRARIANLSMAQDLVDSALENVSLTLRMESMGIL